MVQVLRSIIDVRRPGADKPTIEEKDLLKNYRVFCSAGLRIEKDSYRQILSYVEDSYRAGSVPSINALFIDARDSGDEHRIADLMAIAKELPLTDYNYKKSVGDELHRQDKEDFGRILQDAFTIADSGKKINGSQLSGMSDAITYLKRNVIQQHTVSPMTIADSGKEYIIDGLIRCGQLVFFWGVRNSGKSTLIADLSDAVVTGREWCGFETRKTPVVFFHEMGMDDIAATYQSVGLDPNREGLYNFLADEVGYDLLSKGKPKFESIIDGFGRDGLVVIDTVYSFADINYGPREASSAVEIINYLKSVCKEFSCAIIFSGHPRKAGDDKRARFKYRNEDSFLGSTKWADISDRVISIDALRDDNGEKIWGKGRMRFDKCRGVIHHPVFYTIDSGITYKPDTESLLTISDGSKTDTTVSRALKNKMDINGIEKCTGLPKHTIRRALVRLRELGRVRVVGDPHSHNRVYQAIDTVDELIEDISMEVA